ncbi:MAG: ABC transporter ATP-binding protein [Desulfohalobiaceae bacterium]|nr:ABC transporter ATP-binding protein [Desulfohalobiaceae bacterium]
MDIAKKNQIVQLRNVVKRFDSVVAVEKMDLDIEEGSLVTLLGPSGCGKTTILRMIAGLEDCTEGDIYIKGKRVNDVPVHKRNLGMIFQDYALFPHKTIFDNVAFGLKYRNVSKADIRKRVTRALETVRLPGVEHRKPAQLSGGQQQRIALARAIVIEPDVLLMDEPLSALDENLREEMRQEVDNLQSELGITTIFVTHDQREALSMSDTIIVMKDGLKQQEGGPEEVYDAPVNHFVADFLGHCNFYRCKIAGREKGLTKVEVEGGRTLYSQHDEGWEVGEELELLVRAQKIVIESRGEEIPGGSRNIFQGRVKNRMYMGGEAWYFVEMEDGTVIHAINISRVAPFHEGDEVTLHIPPRHCRLIPKE